MKKKYEKPNMDLEMFEANEYIATCITMKCDTTGDVYIPKIGWGEIKYNYKYHNKACEELFTVKLEEGQEVRANACIKTNADSPLQSGYNFKNYHFSTNLEGIQRTNHS